MGDASIDREKELINKYNLTNIEFLKIGHHGSKTSSSEYFVKKVIPTLLATIETTFLCRVIVAATLHSLFTLRSFSIKIR